MKIISHLSLSKTLFYLGLLLILIGCLWVGWSDFDPRIPQELVRENIRYGIRWVLQMIVQYIVPLAILVFFIKEIAAGRCSKQ